MSEHLSLDARCPACGYMHLVADGNGTITCTWQDCPEPTLVHDLLAKRDQHVHLIQFREDGYTVQHPIVERVRPASLFACDLNDQMRALSGPPGIGLYRVPVGASLDDAEPVSEDDVDFEVTGTPPSREVDAEERQRVANAIPLGTAMPFPADGDLPDGWIVAEQENRLPVEQYPTLAAALLERGFPSMNLDGVEMVAIDLPPNALADAGMRMILHVE